MGVRRLGLGALTQAHHGFAQSLNEQWDSLMSPSLPPRPPNARHGARLRGVAETWPVTVQDGEVARGGSGGWGDRRGAPGGRTGRQGPRFGG